MKKQTKIMLLAIGITVIELILKVKIGISKNNNIELIVINSVIFIITNFFVYRISQSLFKSSVCTLLTIAFNGFAIVSLESFLNNSVYELSNLILVTIIYCHIKIWRRKFEIKYLVFIFILLTCGEIISRYFFACIIAMNIVYTIKMVKNKRYSNLIKYQILTITSIIIGFAVNYLTLKNNIMFNLENIHIVNNMLNYFNFLNKGFFNSLLLPVIIIYLLFIRRKSNKTTKNSAGFLLLSTVLIYSCVLVIFMPKIEFIYIIPIYSTTVISIIYIFKIYLFKFFKRNEAFFLIVITFAVILYSPLVQGVTLQPKDASKLIIENKF